MNIKQKTISISATAIERGLWRIEYSIMQKHGGRIAESDIAPLKWYIATGRASLDFIRKVMTAQPYMIGRKLHQGGSYDEAIQRVKDYIGWED